MGHAGRVRVQRGLGRHHFGVDIERRVGLAVAQQHGTHVDEGDDWIVRVMRGQRRVDEGCLLIHPG